MRKTKFVKYVAPEVEVIEIEVENGYQASAEGLGDEELL